MKTLLVAFVLLTGAAFAKEGGNGGGVHLCENGKIEMYDLYEGYTRYNLTFPQKDMSVEEHLERAMVKAEKFHPGYGRDLRKTVKYLFNEGHLLLRNNLRMELIKDANILVTDNDCSYAQLANWDDVSNNVLVKKEYFDRLSNLGKAALYLHEAVYSLARDYGDVTSDKSRRTNAELLSTKNSAFSNIDDWGERYGVRIVNEPAPASIVVSKNFNVEVHFGDYNFFDPAFKYKVTVDYDYSVLEQKIADLQSKRTPYLKRIEQLQKELENAFFGKTKRQIEYQIEKLNYGLSELDNKIQKMKDYVGSRTVLEFPCRERGSWPEFGMQDEYHQDVKMIAKLFINNELISTYEGLAPDTRNYYAKFSQNRKK